MLLITPGGVQLVFTVGVAGFCVGCLAALQRAPSSVMLTLILSLSGFAFLCSLNEPPHAHGKVVPIPAKICLGIAGTLMLGSCLLTMISPRSSSHANVHAVAELVLAGLASAASKVLYWQCFAEPVSRKVLATVSDVIVLCLFSSAALLGGKSSEPL